MKGFRILYENRVFNIALEKGSCGILIEYSDEKCKISINGAIKVGDKAEPCRWASFEAKAGDIVSIEFTDIENPDNPVVGWTESVSVEQELELYHRLKAELGY